MIKQNLPSGKYRCIDAHSYDDPADGGPAEGGLLPSAPAQVFRLSREQMVHYTAKNPFDRFPDGRPKVDDQLLESVRGLSLEEAWGILLNKGYRHQFAGWDFQVLHPGKKLVGRAATAQYLAVRPDLSEVVAAEAVKQ
jgi:hypothetical protein